MPTRKRNHPYGKFNFLVELGAGDTGARRLPFKNATSA